MKKKDSYRYDPVTTFRELKNLFDKKQFDLYKLSCLIQNLKTIQHNNKLPLLLVGFFKIVFCKNKTKE